MDIYYLIHILLSFVYEYWCSEISYPLVSKLSLSWLRYEYCVYSLEDDGLRPASRRFM